MSNVEQLRPKKKKTELPLPYPEAPVTRQELAGCIEVIVNNFASAMEQQQRLIEQQTMLIKALIEGRR